MMETMKRRKAKILLYTDTKQLGGAENHMLSIFKFYDRMQCELSLACPADTSLDPWCKKIADMTVTVHRINVSHKHDPRNYIALIKIIQKEKIDLLHIHIWNPASGRYGLLAAQRLNIPYIITEHDPFELSPFKSWIKNKLIKDTKGIIAISEKNKELLGKLYPSLKSRIVTIHNGIDTTWFASQLLSFSPLEKEKYREQIFEVEERSKKAGTEMTTPIITTIAELHPRKGLIYLLKACEILTKKDFNYKCIIIGEGEQRKEIESFIKTHQLEKYIILLGRRHEIPHLLAASDVFVLPSLNEAFGLVLLEAMMVGLPIVATNNGGIPEIIEDGKNGILVPPKDAQAIAEAIEKILSSSKLREKMSEKNQEDVRKKFEVKDMVKKTEEVYRSILQDN